MPDKTNSITPEHGLKVLAVLVGGGPAPGINGVISALTIELIDEYDPRHVVSIGLTPDGFALCLDTLAFRKDDHGPVKNAQRDPRHRRQLCLTEYAGRKWNPCPFLRL